MQIFGHRGQSRGDDSAGVIAGRIDNVESYSRSKIDDDGWRAEVMTRRDGVSQSIRADGSGFWVIYADTAQGFGGQFKTFQFPVLANCFADQRRGTWDNAAGGRSYELVFSDE